MKAVGWSISYSNTTANKKAGKKKKRVTYHIILRPAFHYGIRHGLKAAIKLQAALSRLLVGTMMPLQLFVEAR